MTSAHVCVGVHGCVHLSARMHVRVCVSVFMHLCLCVSKVVFTFHNDTTHKEVVFTFLQIRIYVCAMHTFLHCMCGRIYLL